MFKQVGLGLIKITISPSQSKSSRVKPKSSRIDLGLGRPEMIELRLDWIGLHLVRVKSAQAQIEPSLVCLDWVRLK